MKWVLILLGVIVAMLWWIRWALEPVREYFQRRLHRMEEAREMAALDDDEGALAQLYPNPTERAAAQAKVGRALRSRRPTSD